MRAARARWFVKKAAVFFRDGRERSARSLLVAIFNTTWRGAARPQTEVVCYGTKQRSRCRPCGWYEYGESGSWSCGANSDKPIVLYAKKASQWWRVWEYSVGIKLNIGDGGASLEVGAGHASMSASITGNSSIAVSADIERVSVTLSNEIDWKNNTYGEYHQYFLRPWTVGPTAYAVVTSLPVIASILAGVGAGVGAGAGLSPALIP